MKLLTNTLKILAPYDCLSCGDEGKIICNTCIVDLCDAIPSRCYRCKKLTNEFSTCSNCKRLSRLKNVWVCSNYSGIVEKLLKTMKFKSNREACGVIAEIMSETIPILPGDTIVVPIPTATSRIRQRGFDHTKLISRKLANITELPYSNILARIGQTRQVGSNKQDRQKQLVNALIVSGDVGGKNILLVDDMITTGSTIENAALVLKQSGAKNVYAIAFAQK